MTFLSKGKKVANVWHKISSFQRKLIFGGRFYSYIQHYLWIHIYATSVGPG